MDAGTWALLGVVVVLALVVGMLLGLVLGQRRRLDELAAQQQAEPDGPPAGAVVVPAQPTPQEADFVITRVGRADVEQEPVSNRLVLSATVGEPLVKVAALAHGVRRALSPESRNRISFHVRQEVRRTRKMRRREMREAWREMKRQEQAPRDAA